MRKSVYFLVLISAWSLNAQQVQWASKLIKYSSDLGGKQYGIKRILGKPDAFPQGGLSANAWSPKNALDGREVVVVGFEKPQTVRQVAIFENLNAGCVMRIMADNGSGKFETVWSRKRDYKTPPYKQTIPADRAFYYNRKRRKVQVAPDVAVNMGIEHAILENTADNVVALKIEFMFAMLPGQKQIDAIGISDSIEPIMPKINTNDNFEKLTEAKMLSFTGTNPVNPLYVSNQQRLYFSNPENNFLSIYYSELQNGNWSKPVKDPFLNTEDNYNLLEHFSENLILKGGLDYKLGTAETGYVTMQSTDGILKQKSTVKITAYNNYDSTADATISKDENVIILGIESDLSQGGADLYFATRKADGSYMFLQNMGKVINSAADEGMPFLLPDQTTLLFATNGFSCYGDYDIFISRRLDDSWKNWSEPINLGAKVNSGGFDGDPSYDEQTETLYFSRSVGEERAIFSVHIPISTLTKI